MKNSNNFNPNNYRRITTHIRPHFNKTNNHLQLQISNKQKMFPLLFGFQFVLFENGLYVFGLSIVTEKMLFPINKRNLISDKNGNKDDQSMETSSTLHINSPTEWFIGGGTLECHHLQQTCTACCDIDKELSLLLYSLLVV